MFARSSITFNIDDGVSDASPPSPPVSTQMSGRSMKSMTLDDEATSSTMVHYVPWPSARHLGASKIGRTDTRLFGMHERNSIDITRNMY